MKKLFILAFLPVLSFASTLKECETKIAAMVNQVKTTEVKVLSQTRMDKYHLGKDELCGVELVNNILTIAMFNEPKAALAKFEAIILNGSDPTFTDGRVRAIVTCEMSEDSVKYTTKVPVLTDRVKSPFVIEELTVKQTNDEIYMSLRATVTPIHKVFRSITDCTLIK